MINRIHTQTVILGLIAGGVTGYGLFQAKFKIPTEPVSQITIKQAAPTPFRKAASERTSPSQAISKGKASPGQGFKKEQNANLKPLPKRPPPVPPPQFVQKITRANLNPPESRSSAQTARVSKHLVAKSIGQSIRDNQFPTDVEIKNGRHDLHAKVGYTLLPSGQRLIEKLFQRYTPDMGSFVALDPHSGAILAMVNTGHTPSKEHENFSVRATFPAASIFKIVTAAAAIDQRMINGETIIAYNGANHTLYRNNVNSDKENRWTRYISLQKAFARSVNSVFGKLGLHYLGSDHLIEYASRFGFNRFVAGDIPMDSSKSIISNGNHWSLAETASGFTQKNLMSPLQGALIAASIINNGIMMEPYIVRELIHKNGKQIYRAVPKVSSTVVDQLSAAEMRGLMQETVLSGTSQSAFRSFLKKKRYAEIEVGGKTGSLTSSHPDVAGKCDWFVGYARYQNQSIAFAALTVHRKYWRVKSATIARRFIESYFKPYLDRSHGRRLSSNAQER